VPIPFGIDTFLFSWSIPNGIERLFVWTCQYPLVLVNFCP